MLNFANMWDENVLSWEFDKERLRLIRMLRREDEKGANQPKSARRKTRHAEAGADFLTIVLMSTH